MVFFFHFHEVPAEGDGVFLHFLCGAFGVAGDDRFDCGVMEPCGMELLGVWLDGLDDLF